MSHVVSLKTQSMMYVTMRLDKQLLGVDVTHVRDVLVQQPVTPVPLASAEISGALNLRGRIVTVIDLRQRLGLPVRDAQAKGMFVVVEVNHELYSLTVDSVGDVLTVPASEIDNAPVNIGECWKSVSEGVCKLEGELLVLLDVLHLLKAVEQ